MTGGSSAPRPNTIARSDSRALLSVAIQFLVNGMVWSSVAARLPEVRDRAGVTVAGLGIILSLGGALGLLGSAVAGRIVERFTTRTVLLFGGAGLVSSLLAVAFATTPLTLAFGVGAFMFMDVLVDIAMNLQGSWISARRRVPVMNRLHGVWSLGTVLGGLGASLAAGLGAGLPSHITVIASLSAVLVLFVSRGFLAADEDHVQTSGVPSPAMAASPGRSGRRSMAWLALVAAFATVMEQTASDWAAFRLADDLEASAGLAGLAFAAVTAGMTAGRFGGDWAHARLGRDRLHRVAVTLSFVGLAVASLVPSGPAVLAGYAVAGLGIATFFPRIYDDAARLPGRRGAGLGAMTAGSRLAAFGAPSIVGALAATELSVGGAIAILTLPCAVGFALVTSRLDRGRSPG